MRKTPLPAGNEIVLTVKVPRRLIDRIDEAAERELHSRSDEVRRALARSFPESVPA